MKKLKSILCALLALIIVFSCVAVSASAKTKFVNPYPYIFVHGLNGWGGDEGINDVLPYWGATTGNLCEYFAQKNIEAYDASVGPLSSTWDRACELYAQLTGTTVDYGIAHSSRCGHARFGRTYEEPLFEGWGSLDAEGKIKKINLIGHSFGGTTIRMLTYLLCNGDDAERDITNPSEISGLFVGDKADWVNSVTAIATPHNSSTTYTIFESFNMLTTLKVFCFAYAGLAGRSAFNGFVDFHLEQFGLTDIPGSNSASDYRKTLKYIITECEDSAQYDLEPHGAKLVNDYIDIADDIYYFSIPFCTTYEVPSLGISLPSPGTNPVLLFFSAGMGILSGDDGEFTFDETWRPNDGLVNTVSATYPFDEPHTDFNYGLTPARGVWNVFPAQRGDHGTAIGLLGNKNYTHDFYSKLIDMLEMLPPQT